jgi:L-malate glycosyltransferase
MKVLVIPSWYPPNGGQFIREHAMALASAGMQVDVLAGLYTSIRKTSPLRWVSRDKMTIRKEENIREIVRMCPIIPFSERLNYHSWIRTMLSFYDEYIAKWGHPDIIQVHSSVWAGVVASQIKKRYKIPYIITEHRSRLVHNKAQAQSMFRPWYTGPLHEAFKNADAIITVSGALHNKIIDIHPRAEEKLGVIYNMVDTDFFLPAPIKRNNEKKLKLFTLASLEQTKGIDILIEALSILHSKFPGKFYLSIGGDGKDRELLRNMCKKRHLDKQVNFLGELNRPQVLAAFHKADVFVLPNRSEAFGVVFIEAMSCGLPVIAGRSGEPETFITAETGLIVTPDDPQELANAIYTMKLEYQKYNPEIIRDYIVNRFSKEEIASQYTHLYDVIVQKYRNA